MELFYFKKYAFRVVFDVSLSVLRSMMKELPRVLVIYDIDMPVRTAQKAVTYHFRKHETLKDPRLVHFIRVRIHYSIHDPMFLLYDYQ